mmetsp:Transcript_21926/g.33805  ORF Transcript_21926/g.33805 Transcript_21926/m.33805 type:complete len:770 (+) Transcript_21926:55-2364(+)
MKSFVSFGVLIVATKGSEVNYPNGMGCLNESAKAEKYCDSSLSIEERVEALAKLLNRSELVSRLMTDHTSPAIERIGLPEFNYRIEAVHGLEAYCWKNGDESIVCPSYFPITQGVAASFNRSVFESMGIVIAEEAKLWSEVHSYGKGEKPMSLSVRCPIVNLLRDPRWGRSGEAASEDPYLSGEFGFGAVSGLQKIGAAEVKHFAAYTLETNAKYEKDGRKGFDAQVSAFDWTDSYVVAFERSIKDAGAWSYMCSYNAVNNTPSCANNKLSSLAKDDWKMNGFIESDCDAVGDLVDAYNIAANDSEASTIALTIGRTDLDCGDTFYNGLLSDDSNQVSDDDLRTAFMNAMRPLFAIGLFDPDSYSSYSDDDAVTIMSQHQEAALDAARQSVVLLKNKDNVLPLDPDVDKKIALIGPLGFVREQLVGPVTIGPCPGSVPQAQGLLRGGYKEDYSCISTINETLKPAFASPGALNITDSSEALIDQAVALAKQADVVLFALGAGLETIDESNDLHNISLPGVQNKLVQKVIQATPDLPHIAITIMPNQYAVDPWIDAVDAYLHCFIPSGQTPASVIVDAIFGRYVRFGKLPYTMYATNYTDLVDIANVSFINRGYRYYDGNLIVFPFGAGLSYSKFKVAIHNTSATKSSITLTLRVTNLGDKDTDEVIQLYTRPVLPFPDTGGAPIPLRKLVDFDRVTVLKSSHALVTFNSISLDSFALVDVYGNRRVFPGHYELIATNGNAQDTNPDPIPIVIGEENFNVFFFDSSSYTQ